MHCLVENMWIICCLRMLVKLFSSLKGVKFLQPLEVLYVYAVLEIDWFPLEILECASATLRKPIIRKLVYHQNDQSQVKQNQVIIIIP